MIWIIVLAVVIVAAAVVLVMRRPSPESGLESFRRHIDALSPEARRESIERVTRQTGGHRRPTPPFDTGDTGTGDRDAAAVDPGMGRGAAGDDGAGDDDATTRDGDD